jgi:hypothetical protein
MCSSRCTGGRSSTSTTCRYRYGLCSRRRCATLPKHANSSQSAKPVCKCETPAHPDKMLIGCPSQDCGKWMHVDCLQHEAMMGAYKRLGRTAPQVFQEDGGAAQKEGEETVTSTVGRETNGEANGEASAAPAELPLFTPPLVPPATPMPKKGSKKEPYRGLLRSTLDLDSNPSVWRMEDLRDGVTGGVTRWRERLRCLFCAALLD